VDQVTTSYVFTWHVEESRGYETAWVDRDETQGPSVLYPGAGDGLLRARGRAVGTVPQPYWLTYQLETGPGYVTRRLRVNLETATEVRELDLQRGTDGRWTANGETVAGVDGALDCDLGLCPITNTMPVLRHGLHQNSGEQDFLMAWVAVPELAVRPSRQTYTHLGPVEGGGAAIRYAAGDYRSDVVFDADGFVIDYPGMARRLA
jgi:hypothetical protein